MHVGVRTNNWALNEICPFLRVASLWTDCSLLTKLLRMALLQRRSKPLLQAQRSAAQLAGKAKGFETQLINNILRGYYTATHRGGDEWNTHHRCWTPSPLIACVAITQSLRRGPSNLPRRDIWMTFTNGNTSYEWRGSITNITVDLMVSQRESTCRVC